jgi:hypothetical protein
VVREDPVLCPSSCFASWSRRIRKPLLFMTIFALLCVTRVDRMRSENPTHSRCQLQLVQVRWSIGRLQIQAFPNLAELLECLVDKLLMSRIVEPSADAGRMRQRQDDVTFLFE